MWRGDPANPNAPTHYEERLRPVLEALAEQGMEARPLAYFEEQEKAIRAQLLDCSGVLVWINPLADGRDRNHVDSLLREISGAGVWVSAHPDVIAKMGVKDVLFSTRSLGWGSDVDLYQSFDELADRLPEKLSNGGARVLKPRRGNDGQGVFKVESAGSGGEMVRVQSASDDQVRMLKFSDLLGELQAIFSSRGAIIDQEFHANTSGGMVRCYMSVDQVVGFAEQRPRLKDGSGDVPALGMASAKTMHDAHAATFQDLRQAMEVDWAPGLQEILGLKTERLPALWDADFLYRASPVAEDAARFALCEINASCVSPFPSAAPPMIAAAVARGLTATSQS
jgi:hypothetical protein